ncbi:MAG: winged helix DNA-binding domain-containing protein [bacterium]|nr:winged helix DNA-binding domain-containing protein [bacterium]
MTPRTLTLRELNRAVLARQRLLDRAAESAYDVLEAVGGLQAQVANPPYIGLWSRVDGFQRADLERLIETKDVVRATMLRATLHLFTAREFTLHRPALHPAITRMYAGYSGQAGKGVDIDAVCAAARESFAQGPRTFVEIRALMEQVAPGIDPQASSNFVRAHLPILQTAPGGFWGFGGEIRYALPEYHLGVTVPVSDSPDVKPLIRRYLAAFGPATVMDFQTWSGLKRMKDAFEAMRAELVTYHDPDGRTLFDLPDAPLPDGDTPAPIRLIPEYDNLVIAHDDRRRVLADADRPHVFLSAARVRATYLVDGFVAGAWKIEKAKKALTLIYEPFRTLYPDDEAALRAEAERLLRWIDPAAETLDVRAG